MHPGKPALRVTLANRILQAAPDLQCLGLGGNRLGHAAQKVEFECKRLAKLRAVGRVGGRACGQRILQMTRGFAMRADCRGLASGTRCQLCDGGTFDWVKAGGYDLINDPWPDYDGLVIPQRFPETPFAVACRLFGLRDLGPGLSPMNAFLTLTGIETLPLRMERHCFNAKAIAAYLKDHPAVEWVSYPGLPGQTGEANAARYTPKGPGAIFTFALKAGEAAAKTFITSLELVSHLVNIGEIKTLAIHPATTTHRQLSPSERAIAFVGPETVRLSIGLENVEDLIADIAQALEKAAA